MPLHTAEALVLRTYKLGEADRIVVFLTRDRGKKRGVARSARRPRSRFVGALEPLTRVSVTYYENETRELVRLNDVEIVRSPLAGDPAALGHVGYFAELIDEWAPEASPDERLFRLGAAVLDALAGGVPVDPVARYFEYWLLKLQGVYPSIAICGGCLQRLDGGAVLAARDRTFVCRTCGPARGGAGLSLDALRFLRAAGRHSPEHAGELPLSREAGRELELVHRLLIAAHLEKDLRSTRVVRDMRAGGG
jgi:DNA repair protein RecO (recombination protein O)